MEQKHNCETCSNAFVDIVWGEIKCRKNKRYCSEEEIKNGCENWQDKK